MENKYLTYTQSICAARIFLNTLGLILEEKDTVDESSILKIIKNNNTVGKLHFKDNQVIFNATYNDCLIDAHYDIPRKNGGIDYEGGCAVYCDWHTRIPFNIKEKDKNIHGEFTINNNLDSEYGIDIMADAIIIYEIPKIGNAKLNINNFTLFTHDLTNGNYYERIGISPVSYSGCYLQHDTQITKKGEKYKYKYRRYAGVFNTLSDKEKLHVYYRKRRGEKIIKLKSDFVKRVSMKEASIDSVMQKGMLMQKLDPLMYKRINEIRKLLTIDNAPFLDNILSICYDNLQDEIFKVLLGYEKPQMTYQDGSQSLFDSYYGIDKNELFFPKAKHKTLHKKHQKKK